MQHFPLFQHERVAEQRQNLFDMMGDKNERGYLFLLADGLESREEILPRTRIHPRARLIENDEIRFGHPRASDQNLLLFSLRQDPLIQRAGAADPGS